MIDKIIYNYLQMHVYTCICSMGSLITTLLNEDLLPWHYISKIFGLETVSTSSLKQQVA